MSIVLYLLAALLFVVIAWDAFLTILRANGPGPVTRLWSEPMWRCLLRIHRLRPVHRALSLAGPGFVLITILLWYFGLSLSLYLAFVANSASVVHSSSGAEANWLQKIYYVSNTVSGVGYGDWVPSGFPWTVLAALGALSTTIVLTVALSYVISVVSASLARKNLAQQIFGLGMSVEEIIARSGFAQEESSLKNHFLQVSSQITQHAHNHLAYPVLNYFHSLRAEESPARAILLLSDVFFVLSAAPASQRPPEGISKLIDSGITQCIERVFSGIVSPETQHQDLTHLVESVRKLGGPVAGEEAFTRKLEEYRERRRKLEALCEEDGW